MSARRALGPLPKSRRPFRRNMPIHAFGSAASAARRGTRLAFARGEMLRITVTTDAARMRIALAGRLVGPWVDELRMCWLREVGARGPGAIRIDLAEVDFVDAAGRKLLQSLYAQGARLTADNLMMRAILERISLGQ